MNEQMKTDFLRKRMIQLREKNGFTITKLADEKKINKSILSRAEKVGGSTGFKTVELYAKQYCEWFHLSDQQTKMFLRGEKAVVVDISALFKRPDLIGELCEEYSCVFIPSFVIDDLKTIKNNNPDEYGARALDLLNKIQRNERIHTKSYSIPTSSDLVIVDIAKAVSEDFNCDVDIITNDVPLALNIRGCVSDDTPFQLLFLEEYAATRQNLVNMSTLNAINEYYADSYDDIESILGIKLPEKDADDWNYFLSDGRTLIIATVKETGRPLEQRKEKIRWLISNGADVNKRDCESKNFPPITHAIKEHDFEMFYFLLNECHADPNVGSRNPYDVGKVRQKNDGNMPLMVAAWENQSAIVEELCKPEHHVSLNQQDGNGFTALIKACYWGNIECRNTIEQAGADTTILDHEGFTAENRWDECMRLGRYKERKT